MKVSLKRQLGIAALASLLVASGYVAYAYFATTGAGAGTGAIGTSSALTISQTTPVVSDYSSGDGSLYPGTTQTVHFTVNNPSPGHQLLGSITLASWTSNQAGCDSASQPTWITMSPVAVNQDYGPGNGQAVTPTGTITFNNVNVSQDACKGAALVFSYFVLATPGAPSVATDIGTNTMAVSWTGVAGPGGQNASYWVRRYSGATATDACGTSSSAPLFAGPGARTCNDTAPNGTYTYTVTAISGASTEQSPPSRSVVVLNSAIVYINNDAGTTVTPIRATTNTAATPLTTGQPAVVSSITPDGRTLYVPTGSSVIPVNVATNTVGSPFTVGIGTFHTWGTAITPDGSRLYVSSQDGNTVTPVTLGGASPVAGTPIAIGSGTGPSGLTITPDGSTVFVANSSNGTVTPISVATNTAGTPITVGLLPWLTAVTPDGQKLFVLNQQGNSISVINVATKAVTATISGINQPWGIAITPDGSTAFVANAGANTVTPITVATNGVGAVISVGSFPTGVSITPDGKKAYVSNYFGNTVTAIDVATKAVTATLSGFSHPAGGPVTPDQAPTAAFSTTPGAGHTVNFDASTASSPVGSVASYAWDFGDGATLTTASPTTSHTYAIAGSYSVTLTVTNSAGTSLARTFTGQTVSNNGAPSARLILGIAAA